MCRGAAARDKNGSTTPKTKTVVTPQPSRVPRKPQRETASEEAHGRFAPRPRDKNSPGGLDTEGSFREVPPAESEVDVGHQLRMIARAVLRRHLMRRVVRSRPAVRPAAGLSPLCLHREPHTVARGIIRIGGGAPGKYYQLYPLSEPNVRILTDTTSSVSCPRNRARNRRAVACSADSPLPT